MADEAMATAEDDADLWMLEHPEFIVTRVRFRSDPFEIVDHLVKSDGEVNESKTPDSTHYTTEPTLEDAHAAARYQAEKLGGLVEVWQRVACYKAEAKKWC